MNAAFGSVRPVLAALTAESGHVSCYLPERHRTDGAAVMVFPAPGEPRSGYSRVYRELSRCLALLGVATLVVELDLGDSAVVDRWRGRADAARAYASERGLNVVLEVARGLAWVATGGVDDGELALVGPADGRASEYPGDRDDDLRRWGFEEVWRGSPVPGRVAGRIAAARLPPPADATVITHAGSDADRAWGAATGSLRPPASVTDPLFRRVWETSWLVATLSGLVHHG